MLDLITSKGINETSVGRHATTVPKKYETDLDQCLTRVRVVYISNGEREREGSLIDLPRTQYILPYQVWIEDFHDVR
jgi:hypothetical protein